MALRDARDRFGQDYDLHRTEIILLTRDGRAIEASEVWLDAAKRWPAQPDLFGALADIIQADRAAVSPAMWNFLARSESPQDQFAVATRRLEEGNIDGCRYHADRAMQLGAAGSDIANLSYHCTVLSGDLEAAEDRRAQLGSSVMPMLLFQHALLSLRVGDSAAAGALLDEACPRLSGAEQAQCEEVRAGL